MPEQQDQSYHFLVDLRRDEHGQSALGYMREARSVLQDYLYRLAKFNPGRDYLHTYRGDNAMGLVNQAASNLGRFIEPFGRRAVNDRSMSYEVPPGHAEVSIDMAKINSGTFMKDKVDMGRVFPILIDLYCRRLVQTDMAQEKADGVDGAISSIVRRLQQAGLQVGVVNVTDQEAVITYRHNIVTHVDGLPRGHAVHFRTLRGDHNNPVQPDIYEQSFRAAPQLVVA